MIIAIDGPAGAGKSTVARLLAKELGFVYLDTGAIYRALTLKVLNKNIDLNNQEALVQMCKNTQLDLSNDEDNTMKIILDGQDVSERIRLPQITQHVSSLAKIKGVRAEMLKLQRDIGTANSSVIDGRDIGTVVFPNADKKFYLDAEFNERVQRRLKELRQKDSLITQEEVKSDLKNRDAIDSARSCAPLKRAEDAVYIDTTNMTIEEVVQTLLKKINS